MAKRRQFSAEHKREAVGLARASNQPISQVARDLGIEPSLLSRWCRELGAVGRKALQGQLQLPCSETTPTISYKIPPSSTANQGIINEFIMSVTFTD